MTGTMRIGYVVSRFPKTTETFILREMLAVERRGHHVVPFAIRRERDEIVQPGAAPYLDRLTAVSDLTVARALRAQVRLVVTRPRRAAMLWWRAIAGNLPSPKFLLRAVVVAWGAPALAEIAVDERLDHLHAHWGTHSALLAHLVSMITDLPYTLTLHAHDLHVDRTMLAAKLAAAAHVVTISDHNAALVRRLYPEVAGRLSVIHCGVESEAIAFRGDAEIELGAAPARVACVAGLREFKGQRHLLEAIAELRRRGREVVCDLVGDGPLRDRLQVAAGDGVTFHGAVPVDVALDIVRRATVFVMPSVELPDGRRDGIPVALMEAMAIGVPVVSTTVSGIPELVDDGKGGVLVPPGDPLALADAIEALLADDSRRVEMAGYARHLIEREFDSDRSAARLCAIFERSIDGRTGGRDD